MSQTKLAEKIRIYIELRSISKLETLAKAIEKERKKLVDANSAEKVEFELTAEERLQNEAAKFEINRWLSDAALRANQIHMITHAPKYTHGDASGNGVYLSEQVSVRSQQALLGTASIPIKQIDIIGNAAALAFGSLLQLEENGETLLDQLSRSDAAALAGFARDEEQLAEWVEGFSQALKPKELSSHKLSKQLYFPVFEHGYHLLSPLFATSLSHAVYEYVVQTRFSDEAKLTRKLRREGKYTERIVVDFPLVAVQTFGGSNQQNISKLNATRGGRSFLFSSQPPTWRRHDSPPSTSKNSFWRAYERRVWLITKSLRKYLEKVEHRSSNVLLREIRAGYVDDLVSELLQLSAEIQNLPGHDGWSAGSKLPLSEQYWLDPHRDDPDFQVQRGKMNWIEEISKQFSSWLNHQLNRSKVLSFGDVEFSQWRTVMEDALKRDLRSMSQ